MTLGRSTSAWWDAYVTAHATPNTITWDDLLLTLAASHTCLSHEDKE
jgi:hypothetical protein